MNDIPTMPVKQRAHEQIERHRLEQGPLETETRNCNALGQTLPAQKMPSRFVGAADIHSHPLPGIDDGATTLADSVAMLCLAARYGTTIMVATPHRWYQGHENTPELLLHLTYEVEQALAKTHCGSYIQIIAGQEVPLRPETGDELKHRRLLTFGDKGKYLLVEPPFDHLPDWTVPALASILEVGVIPIFAHPERNTAVQRDPTIMREIADSGALIQLTAMSIEGFNGDRARSAARWIIDNGLATVIASDSHSPTAWRPPTMRGAYHVVRTDYNERLARRLCIENPRAIALSEEIPVQETI